MAAASTTQVVALLVSDVQERFHGLLHGGSALIAGVEFLVAVFDALKAPIVVTEQYPKAFGSTVVVVLSKLPAGSSDVCRAEKTQFSMLTADVITFMTAKGVTDVVLCGLETHICVLQTARDGIARGLRVCVVVDAVTSQRSFDRTVALRGLETAGARLTTSESICFELLKDSKHPSFKAVSALVKQRAAAVAAGGDAVALHTV